ncbi:MAG: hypothetical protein HOV80_03985 [Polyangiaceae bacterium]|nr:hypothetical protein [Polyangiaceae bacterium]
MTLTFAASHVTVGANDDVPGISLKISGAEYEMNIWFPVSDLHLLERVPRAPWEQGALKLGTSANADVWWSCDEGHVFVAAGRDDQTWDIGIRFPLAELVELRAAIDEELATEQP